MKQIAYTYREDSTVPAAIPDDIRHALWAAAQQGLSTAELAHRFGLAQRTVRHLLRLARGHDGTMPTAAYRMACPRDLAAASDVFRYALDLKQRHPDWGARFLLGALAKGLVGQALPCGRILRRWLSDRSQPPTRPGRRTQRLDRAGTPQ
jgi:hypothetical protein